MNFFELAYIWQIEEACYNIGSVYYIMEGGEAMKRYVCVAFVIILALAYQSQANAGSLDGTSWLVQVFLYDAIPGRYLGSYIDHFTFNAGQLTTFSGYSGPYWIAPGVPDLPWQAKVTSGANSGATAVNSVSSSRTYYGVAANGVMWGVFESSGFWQTDSVYGGGSNNNCLWLLRGAFYGVPCVLNH